MTQFSSGTKVGSQVADTKFTHNHITICSIHSETGKALERRKEDFKKLHEINNTIAKENGLSLNLPRVNNQPAKLPDNVRQMVKKGKPSWMYDMVQKIDCARASSTSFDEYVGQLKTLGVEAHIEDKNIRYFYGDRNKPVRGKTLGTLFDKEGLIKVFKENDGKFANMPGLREQIKSDIGAAFKGKGNPLGTQSNLLLESASHPGLGKKDYSKFTKVSRREFQRDLPAIFDQRGGALYQEMKRAQQTSIFEYCEKHKIKTKVNEKGQTVLSGKEFVVLTKSDWTNTKNNTQGTIIDFVAIHDETSYLRAVAKINKNPRLLLLEQVIGEDKRGYQPFYIPKPTASAHQVATQTMNRFLNAKGIKGEAAKTLHQSKNVHVGKDASIWLMGEKRDCALEYRESRDSTWKAKHHGNPSGVFLEIAGKSKHLVVYPNPFEFAQSKAKGSIPGHGGSSVLVMMDEAGSDRRLSEFLALNPHISEVHLAQSEHSKVHDKDKNRIHDLNKRFNPFDIEVKELSMTGLNKNRGRGPSMGM
jgi:hypothetical protein